MAQVIACASSKGGSGKSTLTVALASVYSHSEDVSVLIVDADARKRLIEEWYDPDMVPSNITVIAANSDNLRTVIRENDSKYSVIIIDVEGSASLTLAQAISAADFVLIPSNISTQDLRDAIKVVQFAAEVNADSKRQRAVGLVWNRAPFIMSREAKATMAAAEGEGVPVVHTVYERDAYKAVFSYSTVLQRLAGTIPSAPKALNEIFKLAEIILTKVTDLDKEAA